MQTYLRTYFSFCEGQFSLAVSWMNWKFTELYSSDLFEQHSRYNPTWNLWKQFHHKFCNQVFFCAAASPENLWLFDDFCLPIERKWHCDSKKINIFSENIRQQLIAKLCVYVSGKPIRSRLSWRKTACFEITRGGLNLFTLSFFLIF